MIPAFKTKKSNEELQVNKIIILLLGSQSNSLRLNSYGVMSQLDMLRQQVS